VRWEQRQPGAYTCTRRHFHTQVWVATEVLIVTLNRTWEKGCVRVEARITMQLP
jgi:hypothetical protein